MQKYRDKFLDAIWTFIPYIITLIEHILTF
jgi:hypothetical protein